MKNIDYKRVGQKVKHLRMEKDWTQEYMAELCGISTSYLGHIERGSRNLSLETAMRIAEILHVSLDALIIDGVESTENTLSSVEAILNKKESGQKKNFLRIVKVLAENIDDL